MVNQLHGKQGQKRYVKQLQLEVPFSKKSIQKLNLLSNFQ